MSTVVIFTPSASAICSRRHLRSTSSMASRSRSVSLATPAATRSDAMPYTTPTRTNVKMKHFRRLWKVVNGAFATFGFAACTRNV